MSSAFPTVPKFTLCPRVRCFEKRVDSPGGICGELASWKRPGSHWFDDRFVCDEHRRASDVAIDGPQIVRRVRLSVDVLLAGVSHMAPSCQAEAVARLEAAVAALGGYVDVKGCLSTIGQYPAQPATGAIPAAEVDPTPHPVRH